MLQLTELSALQILDTAVKIGLGALISGATTYWITRLNHDRELAKEGIRRRRELLESVAQQVEQFNHVALRYWALIVEKARYEATGREMPNQRRQLLENTKPEIFDSFRALTAAEATLLLLGEKEAQTRLRRYGELVRGFRGSFNTDTKDPDVKQMEAAREDILGARSAFFGELSSRYLPRK